jgi:hypothetical protein
MRLGHEPLETIQVDGVRLDVDEVTPRTCLDSVRAQALAQLGHVYLEGSTSRLRRIVAPELVDEAVPWHDLVGTEKKGGEQRTLLGASERDMPSFVFDFERSENAEIHGLLASLAAL